MILKIQKVELHGNFVSRTCRFPNDHLANVLARFSDSGALQNIKLHKV